MNTCLRPLWSVSNVAYSGAGNLIIIGPINGPSPLHLDIPLNPIPHPLLILLLVEPFIQGKLVPLGEPLHNLGIAPSLHQLLVIAVHISLLADRAFYRVLIMDPERVRTLAAECVPTSAIKLDRLTIHVIEPELALEASKIVEGRYRYPVQLLLVIVLHVYIAEILNSLTLQAGHEPVLRQILPIISQLLTLLLGQLHIAEATKFGTALTLLQSVDLLLDLIAQHEQLVQDGDRRVVQEHHEQGGDHVGGQAGEHRRRDWRVDHRCCCRDAHGRQEGDR